MDEDDVAMKAVASAEEAGNSWDDSIVARGGIIVKIDECFATGIRNVVFQFFHEHGGGGFVAGASSMLTGVDSFVDGCVMEELFPFDSDEAVEVGFVNMDNTETVDFIVTRFLLDHFIHDGLPPIEGVAMADSVIDKFYSGGND